MHARVKVAAVALGAMLSLSACSMVSAITTSDAYDPAEGLSTTVGDISTQNFVLVGTAADEPAALVGTLYNSGDAPVTVTVAIGVETADVVVPALGTAAFGFDDGAEPFVTPAPVAPGFITEISIQVDGVATESKPLPVLDGTFAQYESILESLSEYQG